MCVDVSAINITFDGMLSIYFVHVHCKARRVSDVYFPSPGAAVFNDYQVVVMYLAYYSEELSLAYETDCIVFVKQSITCKSRIAIHLRGHLLS